MISTKGNTGFKGIFIKYTCWFAVFAFLCVVIFSIINKTCMYNIGDGIYQQYPNFMYVGKWIRELFSNFFIEHNFELPMWDMSAGMGSDSLIILSSVANPLADPMCWVSVFIPYRYAEAALNLIIILKMYAAGLSFAYYSYCKNSPAGSIVAGAMVYTFSTVTFMGFAAAWFFNCFYLFPLLLLGVDRLWTNKGFKLFVFMLAWNMQNSYYFTYMMALMVVSYCVIRFICEKEMHSLKKFFSLFLRFVLYSLLGSAIGLGLQLPSVINLMSLDRLSIRWNPELFNPGTVKAYLMYAFSMTEIGPEGPWGVAPIAFIALILLFSSKKKYLTEKALFIVYTLSFFLPVAGSAFNGFLFPTGRYVFGYIFLLAYIVTVEYENLFTLAKKKLYIMAGIALVYLLVTLLLSDPNGFISGVSLMLFTVSLFLINRLIPKQSNKYLCCMASILLTCMLLGLTYIHNYVAPVEVEFGSSYSMLLESNGLSLLNEEERSELSHDRFDYIPYVIDDVPLNSSMITDINSYDFYNSNYNNDIDIYYNKLAINSNPLGYMLNGIRGRNYLELMNGTRYLSIENKHSGVLRPPYSYELLRSDEDYSIYESSSDVSMVYFYDEAVSRTMADSLDPIDIEELMMNFCILDDSSSTPSFERQYTSVDYEITEYHGLTQTGSNTYSAQTGDYILLSFDDIEDSEISVYIQGIDADRFYVVSASAGQDEDFFVFDTFEGREINSMYYHQKNNYMINFGLVDQTVNTIRLAFLEGNYTINDIKIYARSTEQLDASVNSFYDHAGMNNNTYELDGNHVHICANADHDEYLYFAIPYSAGWSATVDGEETEILKANLGFMAIPIGEGEHHVELNYRTPFLTEGLCITFISTTIFIGLVITDRKRKAA